VEARTEAEVLVAKVGRTDVKTKHKRMMAYTGAGRAYHDPPRHPHGVIETLFNTKLPKLEGEAVGFLLFGKNLTELRGWWNGAVSDERHGRFTMASQQYGLIAAQILAEDYLTPQSHIAAWLPQTRNGQFQTRGTVWNLLKRVRERVGVGSNRQLQGLALKVLHGRAEETLKKARTQASRVLLDAVQDIVESPGNYATPN
jgi:hypothetical protein